MFDIRQCSTDRLEQQLLADEEAIAAAHARQLEVLEELDRRQVASGDGCRSLGEWVAWKLDMATENARVLVRTMRRTADRPDLRQALAEGISFDRIEALSRIQEPVGLWAHMDIGGIRRQAARRIGSRAERFHGPDENFLVVQPSLDEAYWKLWGGLDGVSGGLVDKVLTAAADRMTELDPDLPSDVSWRKATALVELCVSDDAPPANVTVFVDAKSAFASSGETGVVLDAGPAVSRDALQALLCDSVTEVVARAEDGRYMDYGRRLRTAPPALQRALMDKYLGACAIDGCDSRNRLQAHHVIPWSEGGATDQDNLILLCWFHHQVVIHQFGFELYTQPNGRTRLRPR
jgi:hypothetical protein